MIRQMKAFQDMDTLCCAKGFVRRGTAFFRIHGDGVLQILKVEKVRHWDAYEISLDLFSMYGELDSHIFTASGCIVRYALVIFCGKRGARYSEKVGSHYEGRIISLDTQVALLEKTVMPFLDEVCTQEKLAHAMCKLDSLTFSNTVIWNDIHKFAPFLLSGNPSSARRVIQAILDQHQFALEGRESTMTPQEYLSFYNGLQEEDKRLIQKLHMTEVQNKETTEAYFQENFLRNCKLSKLIKNKGK